MASHLRPTWPRLFSRLRPSSAPLRRSPTCGLLRPFSVGRIPSRDCHLFVVASRHVERAGRPRITAVRWQSTDAATASASQVSSPTTTTAAAAATAPSLAFRLIRYAVIAISCTAVGFAMASAPAITTINELRSPPSDEQTLKLFAPGQNEAAALELESLLWAHPLVKSLLSDPELRASRPHLKMPPLMRERSLTGGTLMGGDKMTVPPLTFTTSDGSRYVSITYLGSALCGHPGLVHGGMLATIIDEGLARCCFPALPNKLGVTASLKVDYRSPCPADSFVVLHAETTKVEGRKAWVKGRLELLADESKGEKPTLLVESEALFIEPKQAAAMARIMPTESTS